jgi:Carboxypeptidase regulatory-like domain
MSSIRKESPVNDAVVSLRDKKGNIVDQTLTGNGGRFSFNWMAAGTYTIKVAVTGFETASQTVVVENFHVLSISIRCWADVRVVPGARIELATPAFSGRRSTSELPRHA